MYALSPGNATVGAAVTVFDVSGGKGSTYLFCLGLVICANTLLCRCKGDSEFKTEWSDGECDGHDFCLIFGEVFVDILMLVVDTSCNLCQDI